VTATAKDLLFTPVTELVELVSTKQLSPVELVDASLARIEELDPKINAFTLVLADQARAAARESEDRVVRGEARRLEGIPIPIKDIVFVQGTPMSLGSRIMPDLPLPLESEQVARLRAEGAAVLGRTHMPEFGSTTTGESLRFGATRNPWNLDHSPGGSSSGAAAAVAAGMVPAAHGADGGGSLRIPASWTGLFTVKPSRGRITDAPQTDILHTNVFGFLTHTVRDSALLLDVTSGYAFGDMYWPPPQERPYLEECERDPGKLRVGWTLIPPIDVPVHPACEAAVRDAAELLASLGHQVEEHNLDWRDEETQSLFLDVWAGQFGFVVESLIAFGCDPEQLESHNHALWEHSKTISAAQYLKSYSGIQDRVKRVVDSFRDYDVVLLPVTAQPPPRVGEVMEGADENPWAPLIPNSARLTPFTVVFNFTGQPATSWPLGWTDDGLPVGVQAAGRPGDEATLFRLSAQVEAARPWADKHPAL
jgi:amidase